MYSEIFAESGEFKNFLQTVKKGTQAHSYLLISKDGFSAKEMATLFAKALLCPELCETCEHCKKVEAYAHPDVKYYPEGAKLLVEDSKAIVDESYTRPIYADKKIFIISNFELATEAAQNKLLKTLEEPNAAVYYILTTSNIEKVLPTIRSRCNKIELSLVPQDKIKTIIRGDEEIKSLAVALGGGYISKSSELSKKRNLVEIVELAFSLLKDLNSSKEAVRWVKKVIDLKADISLLIEVLSVIIEDALLIKTDKKAEIRLALYREKVEALARELSIKCLSSLCSVLNKAVRDLSYSVNLPLVADNLVMNILEVKYLCK